MRGRAGGDGEVQNIPDDDISRRGGFMRRAPSSLWRGLDGGRGNCIGASKDDKCAMTNGKI